MIRPATREDAEALADLHIDVWEEAYAGLIDDAALRARREDRAGMVARWRTNVHGPARTLLAWQGGRLVGFTSTGPRRDDDPDLPELEVWALYVRAEVYAAGIGHALLTAGIGDAPAYLFVLDRNERALAFYRRQGFELDGVTKQDWVGSELRMVRR